MKIDISPTAEDLISELIYDVKQSVWAAYHERKESLECLEQSKEQLKSYIAKLEKGAKP